MENSKITLEEINKCLEVLNLLSEDPASFALLPEEIRISLVKAGGMIARPDRIAQKRRNKEIKRKKIESIRTHDRSLRAGTGIRKARESEVFRAPELESPNGSIAGNPGQLKSYRNCYICNAEYTTVHHFYDALCPNCGDFNYAKRFQTCDLTGQVALITGSRVKIGFQATLIMLRSGARVICTTRFPVDAATRYASEPDYENWKDRLDIYGLDLRHLPSVELFARYIEDHYERLDLLLNNAAQTVRRPPGFYSHLMASEITHLDLLPEKIQWLLRKHIGLCDQLSHSHLTENDLKKLPVRWNAPETGLGIRSSALLSQRPYSFDEELDDSKVFPLGKLDSDLQQVDLRDTNSWRLYLGEIESTEMIEVQLVNLMAPFILNNRLIHLMKKDNTGCKHIVNVTAMEGKFHRFHKSARHPHTNMAKAALNMMTHTAASELAHYGIFMNAVDTGWVTDEDPYQLAIKKKESHDFQPPLDIVDGAARICDPFIDGILTGKHWSGKFLKDYFPIDW